MKRRITFVLGTSVGGVGVHVLDLAAEFVRRGNRVTVVGPSQTEEHFKFTGVGTKFRPVQISAAPNPAKDIAAVRELRRALADADVVHAHGLRAGALTGLALAGRSTPSVVTLHNAMLGRGLKSRLLTGLEKLAVTRASVVLGASADLVARAEALGARETGLGPVPAPPPGKPTRTRAQVREEFGIVDDTPVVLAVGRLAPQKDYPTLLRAVKSVPGAKFVIVGDGPLRAPLQAEIDATGVDVTLLGHRSDVADLLVGSDVFVLTSTWEARALVIQEAMFAGLPVVATAVGGTPQLVGDAAVLVPVGDASAVAEALGRLVKDRAARAELGQAAREQAAAWPDINQVADDLSALYARLLVS